jgi:hypothetical protein
MEEDAANEYGTTLSKRDAGAHQGSQHNNIARLHTYRLDYTHSQAGL